MTDTDWKNLPFQEQTNDGAFVRAEVDFFVGMANMAWRWAPGAATSFIVAAKSAAGGRRGAMT